MGTILSIQHKNIRPSFTLTWRATLSKSTGYKYIALQDKPLEMGVISLVYTFVYLLIEGCRMLTAYVNGLSYDGKL